MLHRKAHKSLIITPPPQNIAKEGHSLLVYFNTLRAAAMGGAESGLLCMLINPFINQKMLQL